MVTVVLIFLSDQILMRSCIKFRITANEHEIHANAAKRLWPAEFERP
jgi:hypothetical protein